MEYTLVSLSDAFQGSPLAALHFTGLALCYLALAAGVFVLKPRCV